MKKATKKAARTESDSVYFLKILLFFIFGLVWVKYHGIVVFPLGLVLGLAFAQVDHFAIDRKIEYAILIISALLGLMGFGLFLNFA